MMQFNQLEQTLDVFKKYVVQQSKSNLTKQGKKSTGNLYKSIKAESKVSANSFELDFLMESYAEFVDKGVKGADPSRVKNGKQKAPNSPFKFNSSKTMIPTKVLDKWMVIKGVAPRGGNGKFLSRQSLKFAIAKSIHAQGMKPTLFFTKPFEKGFNQLDKDLIKAFGLDVDEFLKFTLKQIKDA